jgi:O-acetyl-ADP-ribose deacetylase (regulator of RNase III)
MVSALPQIILCDQRPDIVRAWRHAFADFPDVDIRSGDLLDIECDAYVSPANSFGVMDGGIDYALRERFRGIEEQVRNGIAMAGSYLPVGMAIVVETLDLEVPYLICAPTMEIPSDVGNTRNAFLAMSALLSALDEFNAANDDVITSIAIPGLCTGIGAMEPYESAAQMAHAYSDWIDRHEAT